jgi:hypothetical protein
MIRDFGERGRGLFRRDQPFALRRGFHVFPELLEGADLDPADAFAAGAVVP